MQNTPQAQSKNTDFCYTLTDESIDYTVICSKDSCLTLGSIVILRGRGEFEETDSLNIVHYGPIALFVEYGLNSVSGNHQSCG